MTDYLNVGKAAQSALVRSLKVKSGKKWREIWENLGVGKSMVHFYCSGDCRIPREKLKKLADLANEPVDWAGLSFVKGNYALQNPSISSMNEKMAEFLGILYGDGCLWGKNYTFSVSGDSHADKLYHLNYIAPMIKELFGLEPRFKFEKKGHNEMHTLLSSKVVHWYIAEQFSFPIGHKKGKMNIPQIIHENVGYKRSFLRGLFDTDGGIHRHHVRSVQIHFTSMDSFFLQEVFRLFISLGFKPSIGKEDIKIFDRTEVIRFFDEIRPANPKHVYKFNQYLETGVVPRHRDIDYSTIEKELNAGAGGRTRAPTLARSSTTTILLPPSVPKSAQDSF